MNVMNEDNEEELLLKLECYWTGEYMYHTDDCTCDDEYQVCRDQQIK